MTNMPFGFSMPGDDSSSSGASGGNGPNPGAFDLGQLGSMLSQLGQMMSQAGAAGQSGPVNYEMARQLAASQVPPAHPVSSVDLRAIQDAVALAEVWLDGVTAFPLGATTVTAWTPREWIDRTMPLWQRLCSPIAERVSAAWVESLPDAARQQAGPLLAMMGSMGGMAFGSQLGQGLAGLATEVFSSTDIGMPLGPAGTAALLPRAVAEFSTSLGLDEAEIRLYLAAREAAHHRLFAHAPWLQGRIVDLITAYASAITVDFSAIEELAGTIDPSNPASIEAALGKGMFEPTINPDQQRALGTLETLLALIEGWVDTVVDAAVADRLPSSGALHETMRRRRATGGPAEQTFATLIGLQLRPRQLRSASTLWRGLGESRGIEGRDSLWADPDLLPSTSDLDDPDGFVQRDREFAALLATAGDWELPVNDAADEGPAAKSPQADDDTGAADTEDGTAADGTDTGGAGASADDNAVDGTDDTETGNDRPSSSGPGEH